MPLRPARPTLTSSFPPRPVGELLWVHATTVKRMMALSDLCTRLKAVRPDIQCAISWEPDLRSEATMPEFDATIGPLAPDQSLDARTFIAHWQPDICLWAGGNLRRGLLRHLRESGAEALLADLAEDELPGRKMRWLPDQRRRLFEGFACIVTPSKSVQSQLQRTGVKTEVIHLSNALSMSATPPSCASDDLTTIQEVVGSRPVWLAAQTTIGGLAEILDGHRMALRLLHRLLLVVAVDSSTSLPQARELVQKSGLQFAEWDEGEEPNEHCQVLLAGPDDLGLWYRASPISLIAASLADNNENQGPLDAAALGSAVLHGPEMGAHKSIYHQLTAAGAARMVQNAQELAEMVVFLSAPDRAAEMALAGWEAVTASAATTDFLLEKIQDLLDRREEHHATS